MRAFHSILVLLIAGLLPGSVPAAAAQLPTIVVDPGHGGVDGGTQNADGTVLEKDLNMQIAQRLADTLHKQGYRVELTRTTDDDVTGYAPPGVSGRHKRDLRGRVEVTKQKNAYLFVSLHGNHGSGKNRGALVFYKYNSLQSYHLAKHIQSQMNSITGFRQTPLKGKYYVIEHSAVPGALIEYGYLSNPDEVRKLSNPAYQQRIAGLISEGIWQYLALDYSN